MGSQEVELLLHKVFKRLVRVIHVISVEMGIYPSKILKECAVVWMDSNGDISGSLNNLYGRKPNISLGDEQVTVGDSYTVW